MELLRAAGEPNAAASTEGLGLLDLQKADQLSVKGSSLALAADRRGYLRAVQPDDRRRGLAIVRGLSLHRRKRTVPAVTNLVIFDCDGVLVDSDRISLRIQAERISALGLE